MIIRTLFIIFALLTLVLCSGCQEDHPSSTTTPPDMPSPTPLAEQTSISVPQGKPPVIDGTLSPGEWEAAVVESFSDGSELFLMYSEGYLYLGVRANTPGMIAGNIFIDHGDEIAILHASAALGTARYQKEPDSWHQIQDFSWRCRQTGVGGAAQAERDAFLVEEHWVAANSRMGAPNELEYRIEVSEATLRLAVNFLRASDPNVKIPWPKGLDDDCTKPTPGGLPEQLHFSLERWANIELPR